MDAMHSFMATIRAHLWCQTPIYLCWLSQRFHNERFCIRHVHRPLNNKLPMRGTSKFKKLGPFQLYPTTSFAVDLRSAVTPEVASLCPSLPVLDQLQVRHSSQDGVEGTLWNTLFTKVSARLKRETNVRKKAF